MCICTEIEKENRHCFSQESQNKLSFPKPIVVDITQSHACKYGSTGTLKY